MMQLGLTTSEAASTSVEHSMDNLDLINQVLQYFHTAVSASTFGAYGWKKMDEISVQDFECSGKLTCALEADHVDAVCSWLLQGFWRFR